MSLIDRSDINAGWALADEGAGREPAIENSQAWGHVADELGMDLTDQPQVAGVGSAVGRVLGRALSRDISGAVKRKAAGALSVVDQAAMQRTLQEMKKERIEGARARASDLAAMEAGGEPPLPMGEGAPMPRPSDEINLERHHPGASAQDYVRLSELAHENPADMLKMIRTAEEVGDILDVVARGLKEKPRTHASIRADGPDFEAASKALTQEGLANDRQLFALRSIMATLGEKSALLARKIYQGDHTPSLLLEWEQVSQQLIAFEGFTKGQTREVARALSQQNMVADVLGGNDLRAMELALREAGGNPEALVKAASALSRNLDKGMDPALALKKSMKHRTYFEAVVELWKANSLSATSTHVANSLSGVVVSAMETLVRVPAVGIGKARAAMGATDVYSRAEFAEGFMGGITGLRHSLGFFWDTLLTGETKMGAYGGKEVGSSAAYQRFGSPLGMSANFSEAALTPAFRLMKAADEAIMVPAYMSQLSGLAARDGVRKGLSGNDLAQHVDNILLDPPADMQQSAFEHGRKVVMQASSADPADAGMFNILGEHVHSFVKRVPIFEFVVPWIKTPARIMDYMVESSALAAVSPRIWKQVMAGGPDADIALGKIVTGTAVTAAAYPIIMDGRITGAGPENPEQRAALERLGWQQYSVKVGDTYVSYRNWADPVVGLIAGMATAYERARFARRDEDVAKQMATSIFAIAEYAIESSYMEGFKRLFEAAKDSSGKVMAQFLGAVATGFVPYSSAVAAVARASDDKERSKSRVKTPGFGGEGYVSDLFDSVKQDFKLRLPGLRDTARPARYWDGTVKVPEAGQLLAGTTPFKMREAKIDPPSAALLSHGVNISEPRSRLSIAPGYEIELLDFDGGEGLIYDKYIKSVGEARRELVRAVIASDEYNADSPVAGLALDRAIAQGARLGRARFLSDTFLPLIRSGVEQAKDVALKMGLEPEEFLQMLVEGESPTRAETPANRRQIDVAPDVRFQ